MPETATLNGTTYAIPDSRWETRPIRDLLSVVNGMSGYSPGGGGMDGAHGHSDFITLVESNGLSWSTVSGEVFGAYSQSTHTHDFAATDHTHSSLYIPLGDSTAYQTATLATKFLTTAAGTGHTHSDLYPPISGTSAYQTATLASTFAQTGHTHSNLYIPLGDSTAYQTATLATKFLTTAEPAGKTHSDLYIALGDSTAYQTATLATKFLTTAAPTGHTHSDLYIALGNSTAYQTATLSTALMNLSFSSAFQTATLATKFLTTAEPAGKTHSDLYIALGDSTAYQTATLATKFLTTAEPAGKTHSDLYIALGDSTAYQTATLATKFLTTAAAADHSHNNPTLNLVNLSGATASASSGFTLSLTAAAGGAVTVSHFEPNNYEFASATSTGGLHTLHVQPFELANYLSFTQVNLIGSASVIPTSCSNRVSFRLTNNQSIGYSAVYSITNSVNYDMFLFSRGTGGFSTEIETFTSRRDSIVTFINNTYYMTANKTDTATAGSTGSWTLSRDVSVRISYPIMTSGTMTSVNAASTITTWQPGYSEWNSTAKNSLSNTYNTTAAFTTSLASTWPAAANWASNKLVPFALAYSLSPGQYWIGMKRWSSTSSSSTYGSTITAAGTGASYSNTYNASDMNISDKITWLGFTNTLANSLGWLGNVSLATMVPAPGLGSFSATWASDSTYNNNLGNPVGAIGFSQISSNVSMFRSWLQFANNRF